MSELERIARAIDPDGWELADKEAIDPERAADWRQPSLAAAARVQEELRELLDYEFDLGVRTASEVVMNAGRPTVAGEWSTGDLAQRVMEKCRARSGVAEQPKETER